ncbi:MAG TPA: RNA methyltransferase [Burkholderiales bacterium]|nr:RNA methyltransferase [Burkholderiales bacterium]
MMTPAALGRVRVVLCETSHPGNIGAAARAMKTMGLSRLVLVNPKLFPHPEADALATGADDVLAGATVCENLDQALAGTVLAVAATARHRDLAHEVLDCREACARIARESEVGEVALVFGTERSGLTARQVSRCHLIATIPTDDNYSSLNLAQAVQVFAYELRMSALGAPAFVQHAASREGAEMATHEEMEGFLGQLEETFYSSGFLDPAEPKRLMQRMRRLFARARTEKTEVNILRGFLSAIRSKLE